MKPSERSIQEECYSCVHSRSIPGDCHTKCVKPDPTMTGDAYGRSNGWFRYPNNFDPTWKTKLCANYEATKPKGE